MSSKGIRASFWQAILRDWHYFMYTILSILVLMINAFPIWFFLGVYPQLYLYILYFGRINTFLTNTHASHVFKSHKSLIYVAAQMTSYHSKQTKILSGHSPKLCMNHMYFYRLLKNRVLKILLGLINK